MLEGNKPFCTAGHESNHVSHQESLIPGVWGFLCFIGILRMLSRDCGFVDCSQGFSFWTAILLLISCLCAVFAVVTNQIKAALFGSG